MLCNRVRPDRQYWEWTSQARHVVLSVTHTTPSEPWVEFHVEVVVRFRYPSQRLTHKSPGHPHRGPLYMALHAPEALPSEPGPALRTHYRKHFGIHGMLQPPPPPPAPTMKPIYLQPRTEPGIWFHDLPPLATFQGAIAPQRAWRWLSCMNMRQENT